MTSRWIVRHLGCHFGWHGNIMALDHPKMVLGVHRDRMHESKVSLDGFMIRRSQSSHPSIEQSIFIATILKISKLQDYLVLAVVVRELSKHLFDWFCYCEVHIVELLLLRKNKDTTGKIVSTWLLLFTSAGDGPVYVSVQAIALWKRPQMLLPL